MEVDVSLEGEEEVRLQSCGEKNFAVRSPIPRLQSPGILKTKDADRRGKMVKGRWWRGGGPGGGRRPLSRSYENASSMRPLCRESISRGHRGGGGGFLKKKEGLPRLTWGSLEPIHKANLTREESELAEKR